MLTSCATVESLEDPAQQMQAAEVELLSNSQVLPGVYVQQGRVIFETDSVYEFYAEADESKKQQLIAAIAQAGNPVAVTAEEWDGTFLEGILNQDNIFQVGHWIIKLDQGQDLVRVLNAPDAAAHYQKLVGNVIAPQIRIFSMEDVVIEELRANAPGVMDPGDVEPSEGLFCGGGCDRTWSCFPGGAAGWFNVNCGEWTPSRLSSITAAPNIQVENQAELRFRKYGVFFSLFSYFKVRLSVSYTKTLNSNLVLPVRKKESYYWRTSCRRNWTSGQDNNGGPANWSTKPFVLWNYHSHKSDNAGNSTVIQYEDKLYDGMNTLGKFNVKTTIMYDRLNTGVQEITCSYP